MGAPEDLLSLVDSEIQRSPYKERAKGHRVRELSIANRVVRLLLAHDDLVLLAIEQSRRRAVLTDDSTSRMAERGGNGCQPTTEI